MIYSLIESTVLKQGEFVLLDGVEDGIANLYSFTGLLISSYNIDGNNNYIMAPSETGFYILQIKTDDRSYVYKIWVK